MQASTTTRVLIAGAGHSSGQVVAKSMKHKFLATPVNFPFDCPKSCEQESTSTWAILELMYR